MPWAAPTQEIICHFSMDAQDTPDTFCTGHGIGCMEDVGVVAAFHNSSVLALARGFTKRGWHNMTGRGGVGPKGIGRYQADVRYSKGSIVRRGPAGADGYKMYRSKADNNRGHAVTDGTWWEELTAAVVPLHGMGTSYAKDFVVKNGAGNWFVSLHAANLGNALPAVVNGDAEDTHWKLVAQDFLRFCYRADERYPRAVVAVTWWHQPRYAVSLLPGNTGRCPLTDAAAWTLTWAAAGSSGTWSAGATFGAGVKVLLPQTWFKAMKGGNEDRSPLLGVTYDTLEHLESGNGWWMADEGISMDMYATVKRRLDGGAWLRTNVPRAISADRASFNKTLLYVGAIQTIRLRGLLARPADWFRVAGEVVQYLLDCGATAVGFDGSNRLLETDPLYHLLCLIQSLGIEVYIEAWANRWDTENGVNTGTANKMTHMGRFNVFVPGGSVYGFLANSETADVIGGVNPPYQVLSRNDFLPGTRFIAQLGYEPGGVDPSRWDYIVGAFYSNMAEWIGEWIQKMRDHGFDVAIEPYFLPVDGLLSTYAPPGYAE